MHTFFVPDLAPTPGGTLELPREEAEHAVRVLRLRDGDLVHLVDGKGLRVLADEQIIRIGYRPIRDLQRQLRKK